MNDVDQQILRVFDAYKAAVFAKDVDAFVALYHADVCVFDLWGTWSYDGLEAWRAMVVEWFGSLGSERVAVEVDDVQTYVTNDLAVAHAFIRYTGVSAEGQALRDAQPARNALCRSSGPESLEPGVCPSSGPTRMRGVRRDDRR